MTQASQFPYICLCSACPVSAQPRMVKVQLGLGSVGIAIIRTKSLAEGDNPQTYINIETYSIGFTALFFWVISTITLTSVIGTSQSADSIPNILSGFRRNLCQAFPTRNNALPQDFDPEERYYRGGIYSWQPYGQFGGFFLNAATRVQHLIAPSVPQSRRRSSTKVRLHQSWPWFCTILPLLSVSFGTIIGMTLTSLVPPEGWSCRSSAEIAIFAVWLVSYPCTLIPFGRHHRFRFWFTFLKDLVTMAATLGLIIATQIGIFNKCACYAREGKYGLALPQSPIVKKILEHNLDAIYPAITVLGILSQLLLFPGIIMARYYAAIRVFLQRDDGERNLQWWYDFRDWSGWMTSRKAMRSWFAKKHSEGLKGDASELGQNATLLDTRQDTATKMTTSSASHVEEISTVSTPREWLQLPTDIFAPIQERQG